jgi:hypothetical protein
MRCRLTALTLAALMAPAALARADLVKPSPIPAPNPPIILPGDARAATASTEPGVWIVGADANARRAPAIARRFGARSLASEGDSDGAYTIAPRRARAFAAALRRAGALLYAEPDYTKHYAAEELDPLSGQAGWREVVVNPALTSPPVTPTSPKLVLIDAQMDTTHPEFVHSNIRSTLHNAPTTFHGTATMGVAAAPHNGIGIVGIWPNMRAYNYATDTITCAASARQIIRAVRNGAATINMSYGSDSFCYSEFAALQKAFAAGVVTVASAGNEFGDGNPLEYPASLPHVLTVAAIGSDSRVSPFSNTNNAVDLSAPGTSILTTVPKAFDNDGTRDGYTYISGTSFSAPMVAAAATWVRQVRPSLDAGQIGQAIRLSAVDLQTPGWDSETGYGLLSIRRALRIQAPPDDPLEPNDGMVWVDGRAFGKPDPPIFPKGARSRTVDALVDQYEDPDDVYRVIFPAHTRLRFDVKPSFGDSDLELYAGAAKTFSSRYLLARSEKNGTRLDRIVVRNTSDRTSAVYVHVYINPAVPGLDSAYRLRVTRLGS